MRCNEVQCRAEQCSAVQFIVQVCVCEGDVRLPDDWASVWRNCKEQLGEVRLYSVHWDNVWKSRWCIVVNGVPREVPTPKPEPRGFVAKELSEGLHSP